VRFLVAGGAGFVGSHVCRRLCEDGHEVVCLDNLLTGSLANIADLRDRPDFRFVEADAAAAPRIEADIILHLASPASPVDYDRLPLETLRANSLGTWRLLDLAAETGAHLTFVSTSEVYGDPLVHPQPETYWGNVDPIGPRACYDEGKRFGEALLMSMRRVTGVRASIIRVFNTYGPAMRLDDGRVVPEMLAAALDGRPLVVHGDGSQTRSFQFVSDLVAGLLLVACDPASDGEVFNVGNPGEFTIAELAEAILRLTGSASGIVHVEARPGDPQRRRPDISRMRDRFGWEPRVALEDGLRLTADWFATRRGSPPAVSASE
jgi:nucleoside-diphosphate-sugar epimerase